MDCLKKSHHCTSRDVTFHVLVLNRHGMDAMVQCTQFAWLAIDEALKLCVKTGKHNVVLNHPIKHEVEQQ